MVILKGRLDKLALLAIITAIVSLITAALGIFLAGFTSMPSAPTGYIPVEAGGTGVTVNAVTWFFDLILDGIAFFHNLFSTDFWAFAGSCLSFLISLHFAYITYSIAIGIVRAARL